MNSANLSAAEESGFFDGRYMIEIERWNWELGLGLSSPRVPRKYRFQGGLMHPSWIDISGRIRAPGPDRGKNVRVAIQTFGPELTFGKKGDIQNVGRFERAPQDETREEIRASLWLPESDLAPAITCLGSVWKFLDIWVTDDSRDAAVKLFAFSDRIHPNLTAWAGSPLDSP